LAYAITALDWHFVFRERPFTTLPSNVDDFWKNIWIHISSFPSGHTRETTMYATIIASFVSKLKWPMIILTIFVGFTRLYVGAHYPTDVLAGFAIGFLTGKVVLLISREIQIVWENRKGVPHGQRPKASISN
jgi:membrane-associated phospholipid phosphatase